MTIELSPKTVEGFAAYSVAEGNSRRARIVAGAAIFDQLLSLKTKTERGQLQDAIVMHHSALDVIEATRKGYNEKQAKAAASFFSNPANVKKFMKIPSRFENSDYRTLGYEATGAEMLRLIEEEAMASQTDWENFYFQSTPSGQRTAREQTVRKKKAAKDAAAKVQEPKRLPAQLIADLAEKLSAECDQTAAAALIVKTDARV